MLSLLWQTLFGWLPAMIQIVFFIFVAILAFFLVLRIIAVILDAIPFL